MTPGEFDIFWEGDRRINELNINRESLKFYSHYPFLNLR
jgi:hypothetical protein